MKDVKKKEKDVEWDKKRIVLFLVAAVILLAIGFQARSMILGENTSPKESTIYSNEKDVKGASVVNPSEDIKKNIQNQINSLKSEAENINLVDVASSSPQVQKVINDLKALQDLPSNQLKQTCERICSGL